MSSIVIDGLSEEDFRRSIQNRLREGKAGSAIARLRALLAPYAQAGGILPERFLTIAPGELILTGWDSLGDAIGRHDRPGRPVNAVSIAFGWPGDDMPEADARGCLRPCIETNYYNDDAFPFSQSRRDDLLDGYSFDGCTWSGDPEATDNAIGLDGIDDLNGALAELEARLLASDEPDEAGLRAGSLGACLLSALLVQAVTERIERDGLPRSLCVTAGSSGVYPYFDAPLAGMSEEALTAAAAVEDVVMSAHEVPVPRYSSLLLTGIPRAKKRAVLVLEESEDELTKRLTGLRSLHHADREDEQIALQEVAAVPPATDEPEPGPSVTDGELLLAKKPVKHSADFRDMLGPRAPALQQRLDDLVASRIAPIPELPVLAPVEAERLPVPDWSDEPAWSAETAWLDGPTLSNEPTLSHEPAWSDEPGWQDNSDPATLPEIAMPEAELPPPAERTRDRLWASVKAWFDWFR